jgi:WD40 repeat protein
VAVKVSFILLVDSKEPSFIVFTIFPDSRIYIWHKENGTLVETLEAHTKGCVNSISWSPTNPGMFVSAGDDKAVRM